MIWGTLIGILGGVLQDGIGFIKDKKTKEQDNEHQINLEKVRSEARIKEFEAGLLQEQEKTKQAEIQNQQEVQKTIGINAQSNAIAIQAENETEATRYDNITKATQYLTSNGLLSDVCNFFIATARPLITYLLGFLMFYIVHNHENYNQTPEWMQDFILTLGMQFDAAVSFWFYRRSSEKIQDIKKKL